MNAASVRTPPKFDQLLDVNSVLELGYSIHVTNDVKNESTKAGRTARQLIDEFHSWRAPVGSPDHIYLFKTKQLALTLGQGITRRKLTYLKEVEAAEHRRTEALDRLTAARNDDFWFNFWLKAAAAAGIMAIAAAIGFALASTVLPFVPLRTEHAQNAVSEAGYWPSILVAGVFAAISRNIAKWLTQQRLEAVFREYEVARQQAWIRYQRGKLTEYERTEEEIRRLFQEYTGRRAPRCVSYCAILNEEINTDKALIRERQKMSENVLTRTLSRFQKFRKSRALAKRKKNGNGNGSKTLPPHPPSPQIP